MTKCASGNITFDSASLPEFAEPHLTLASPAGIETTTAGSTHLHSEQHHAVTAGGHASVSAGRSWLVSARDAIKMFAYRSGMKLIAAGADIDIHTLERSIHVLARMDITLTANRITLTARERVTINGGGSYTTWEASGITSGTEGTHTVRAASHGEVGPRSMPIAKAYFLRSEISPNSHENAAYPFSV